MSYTVSGAVVDADGMGNDGVAPWLPAVGIPAVTGEWWRVGC